MEQNNITAVEWLKTEIEKYGDPEYLIIRWADFDELIKQAKQIEKTRLHQCASFWRGKDGHLEMPIFNEYYNETFGNH